MVDIYFKQNDYENAKQFAYKAAEMFKIHGQAQKMTLYLVQIAKQFEKQDMQTALEMYEHSWKVLKDQEQLLFAKDVASPLCQVLIQLKKFGNAIQIYQEELQFALENNQRATIQKDVMSIIALSLILDGDVIAQEKLNDLINQVPGLCTSNEFEALNDIIQAMSAGDQEEFTKQAKRSIWNLCETSLIRLIRDYKIPTQTNILEEGGQQSEAPEDILA